MEWIHYLHVCTMYYYDRVTNQPVTFVIFIHISSNGSGSGSGLLQAFMPFSLHMASYASTMHMSDHLTLDLSLSTSNNHPRTISSTCNSNSDLQCTMMVTIIINNDVKHQKLLHVCYWISLPVCTNNAELFEC